MLALLSVWIGMAALAYALAIVFWRRLFSDAGVTFTIYAAIFSLTFAGLTLWNLRRRNADELGVRGQRAQAWVGTCLSILAIACIYLLIGRAQVMPRSGDNSSARHAMLCSSSRSR